MPKRVNPQRVKIHHTLTVSEWAIHLIVHKNTVLRWVKCDGLPAITDCRPWLIRGHELKPFLIDKYRKRGFKCRRGELPCFGCRTARRPAGGMIDYHPSNKTSGLLKAICEVCGSMMNRSIRLADVPRFFPECELTIMECPRTLSRQAGHLVNVDKSGNGPPGENLTDDSV